MLFRSKQYFTLAHAYQGKSWKVYIKNASVWMDGTADRVFDGASYFNAIQYLGLQDEIAPFSVPAVLGLPDKDRLRQAIHRFNAAFRESSPAKKIGLASAIERPSTITDYLKQYCDYKCQICGVEGFDQKNGTKYVEAHHIMALHTLIPGSYCSDNIIIVCANCHRKLHFAHVSLDPIDDLNVQITIGADTYRFCRNIITIEASM